jgi:hypothetical protein
MSLERVTLTIQATLDNEIALDGTIALLHPSRAAYCFLLLHVSNRGAELDESRLGRLFLCQGTQRQADQRLRVRATSQSPCVSRRMDVALCPEMVRRDRRDVHRLVEVCCPSRVHSDTRQPMRREGANRSTNASHGDSASVSTGPRSRRRRHPAMDRAHAICTSIRWHTRSIRSV